MAWSISSPSARTQHHADRAFFPGTAAGGLAEIRDRGGWSVLLLRNWAASVAATCVAETGRSGPWVSTSPHGHDPRSVDHENAIATGACAMRLRPRPAAHH